MVLGKLNGYMEKNEVGPLLLDLPSARTAKGKLNKWVLTKLNHFYTANETIDKRKKKPIEWEKIFAPFLEVLRYQAYA